MFFKQIIVSSLYYTETFIPNSLTKTYLNLKMPNLSSSCQMNKNISSSSFLHHFLDDKDKNLPQNQSQKEAINSKDRSNLEKWIQMLRYEGAKVPNKISEEQFLQLYSMLSEARRVNYLYYLFKKEIAQEKDKIRKEKRKELRKEILLNKLSEPNGHIEYGLWKNTLFSKVGKSHFRCFSYNKFINAVKFGQPLVIDMDYYDYMEGRDVSSLARQLNICITQNRVNPEPFNLVICNADFNCKKFKVFTDKHLPKKLPMTVTSQSYLDLFPNEKLVYLTQNAKTEMKEFDHNAVYIIGGLIDRYNTYPLTLAKTKRENIQAMRLPFEKYHAFRRSKSLAIHVLVNILLDLQKDGDFEIAFKNIPRRLILTGDESHMDPYDYNKQRKF